jgi:DNA-binding transcriptional MerR regulator
MLRIGEFSRLGQVTVKTLRFYDEMKLLEPAKIDPFTSYRYYSVDQLPRLNRILALKELGLSLEQISCLLMDGVPTEQLRGMLRLKQLDIQRWIAEEQERLVQVEARLRLIEEEEAKMPDQEVIVKKIESQKIVAIRAIVPGYGAQGPLWNELGNYLVKHAARASGPSLTLYHDTEFKESDVDLETATPIGANLPEEGQIQVYQLPGVDRMACLTHQGSYDTLSESYGTLMSWIAGNGYHIVGPNREIYLKCPNNDYEDPAVFGDFSGTTDDPNQFLTEIQFPVEK